MALLSTPPYIAKHLYLESFIEKALGLSQKDGAGLLALPRAAFGPRTLSLQHTDHWLLFANGMDE